MTKDEQLKEYNRGYQKGYKTGLESYAIKHSMCGKSTKEYNKDIEDAYNKGYAKGYSKGKLDEAGGKTTQDFIDRMRETYALTVKNHEKEISSLREELVCAKEDCRAKDRWTSALSESLIKILEATKTSK